MATRPAASPLLVLLLVLLFLISVQFGSAGETIRAEPGKDAILPCESPEKKPVIIVEWRRCDLEGNDHVALYQDDQFDNEGQNPAYKDRVDLLDREIKNGNVSLVLKNVTTNDTGTYECRVNQTEVRRRKRSHLKNEPIICIINLVVSAPGNKEGQKDRGNEEGQKDRGNEEGQKDRGNEEGQKDRGNEEGQPEDGGTNTGLIAGLSVGLLVLALLAVSGFLLYKKPRRSSQEQNQPPAAEAELQAMNVENHPEPEM